MRSRRKHQTTRRSDREGANPRWCLGLRPDLSIRARAVGGLSGVSRDVADRPSGSPPQLPTVRR